MSLYLVLGSPVSHSLSPAMMNAAFESVGRSDRYEAREIDPATWPKCMRALHTEGIAGANVTVPLKEGAVVGAWEVTDVAREIGAANTLERLGHGWRADNTDGPGFLNWMSERNVGVYATREALVLGAGGSARAIVWAMLRAGCPHVRLANRTRERAEALLESLGRGRLREKLDRVSVEAPGRPAPEGGLVIHCTSLGLRPDDPSPISPDHLEGAAAYLDLVYPDPPGVRAAREARVKADDGLGLLVHQGVLSFERWTGIRPDARLLREAVDTELRRRRGV